MEREREREREIRMQTESQEGEYVGAIIPLAVIGQPNHLSIKQSNEIRVLTFYHRPDNVSVCHDLRCLHTCTFFYHCGALAEISLSLQGSNNQNLMIKCQGEDLGLMV